MEVDEGMNSACDASFSCPMNGGDGPHSYSNNSRYQRRLIEASKELINEAIEEKLEMDYSSCVNGSKAFGIADLGCSVGNNTFIAMHNIIVLDRESPAWNGNRIHYSTTSSEIVHEAYAAQFKNDLECFLSARAQELVGGGLILILIPGQSSRSVSQTSRTISLGLLESCLFDMVNLGCISEKQVDSFNIPTYFPTLKELEEITKNDGNFSTERIGIVSDDGKVGYIKPSAEFLVGSMRAAMEQLFKQHFGNEVTQYLFQLFAKKVAHNLDFLDTKLGQYEDLFVILKRKMN